MFDGGFYLVAFARPVPALLALGDDAWQTPDPIGLAAQAAQASGFAIGLLRTERGLRQPADVSALLADPLLDDEPAGPAELASEGPIVSGEWCNGSTRGFDPRRSGSNPGSPAHRLPAEDDFSVLGTT